MLVVCLLITVIFEQFFCIVVRAVSQAVEREIIYFIISFAHAVAAASAASNSRHAWAQILAIATFSWKVTTLLLDGDWWDDHERIWCNGDDHQTHALDQFYNDTMTEEKHVTKQNNEKLMSRLFVYLDKPA